MIATAPGKLILTGEYAVLDGAPALVIAVDRRVVARRPPQRPGSRNGGRLSDQRGSSPFLIAVADELRDQGHDLASAAALEIAVDSSAFYDGAMKLGLGSSAAVTTAATALALGDPAAIPSLDRAVVHSIAAAAHARAQGPRGARGSGADIAAAVHGGAIEFTANAATDTGTFVRRSWPATVELVPFFTGASADTATLVAQVAAARAVNRTAVDAALIAIADASRAACGAVSLRDPQLCATATIAAMSLAGAALDRLAIATGVALVPAAIREIRRKLAALGGTAKTTGAGGGDVAIAVIPATEDRTAVRRYLIESGCAPLDLSVDPTGVDLRPDAQ